MRRGSARVGIVVATPSPMRNAATRWKSRRPDCFTLDGRRVGDGWVERSPRAGRCARYGAWRPSVALHSRRRPADD